MKHVICRRSPHVPRNFGNELKVWKAMRSLQIPGICRASGENFTDVVQFTFPGLPRIFQSKQRNSFVFILHWHWSEFLGICQLTRTSGKKRGMCEAWCQLSCQLIKIRGRVFRWLALWTKNTSRRWDNGSWRRSTESGLDFRGSLVSGKRTLARQ